MSYYYPKWMAIAAMLLSVVYALGMPFFGFIMTNILFIMMAGPRSPTFVDDRNFYIGMFLLLCGGIGIVSMFIKLFFQHSGENLTFTIRKLAFQGIIYKHLWWFDSKDRAPGILSNVLAEDITEINGLSTEVISIMVEAVLEVIIGIIVSCYFCW